MSTQISGEIDFLHKHDKYNKTKVPKTNQVSITYREERKEEDKEEEEEEANDDDDGERRVKRKFLNNK